MRQTPPSMASTRRRLPLRRRRALAALGAGLLLAFSLPPWGWWPSALVGLVLLDRAMAGASGRERFRRGWLTGVGLLAPSTIWIGAFTPPGYLIEVVAYSAILGVILIACPSSRWRWVALPGAWAVFEAIKGRWPFGGVPLSELAVGQVAGPLGGLARIGGILLVGLVTVAAGMAIAAAVRRAWVPAGVGALLVVAAIAAAAVAPRGEPTGETITVAYVQGGGEQGTTDEETDDREVFLTHLRATEQVPVGTDLTVWPENVVNVDGPIETVREGRELAALAREKETTLIAGVVEGIEDDDEHFYNAAVVFGPDGEIIGRYDKVRRVPFGEFVPFRGFLENIVGDALPSKDAIAGEESNTLDLDAVRPGTTGSGTGDGSCGEDHPVESDPTIDCPAGRVGIVISWEVFFGDRARDAVNGRGRPAELLLNPTNGSSYSGTLVQSQQISHSRLRAIETGRWTVQVAPTGFSAFVTDEGDVLDRSGVSEQRVEVREVPLREGRTLWLIWGAWPQFLFAVAPDRRGQRRRPRDPLPPSAGTTPVAAATPSSPATRLTRRASRSDTPDAHP